MMITLLKRLLYIENRVIYLRFFYFHRPALLCCVFPEWRMHTMKVKTSPSQAYGNTQPSQGPPKVLSRKPRFYIHYLSRMWEGVNNNFISLTINNGRLVLVHVQLEDRMHLFYQWPGNKKLDFDFNCCIKSFEKILNSSLATLLIFTKGKTLLIAWLDGLDFQSGLKLSVPSVMTVIRFDGLIWLDIHGLNLKFTFNPYCIVKVVISVMHKWEWEKMQFSHSCNLQFRHYAWMHIS